MVESSPTSRPETAQTLDRGLRLLHLVADATNGVTVTEAAAQLGVGRAVVYRLVGTLAEHGLVRRDRAGRVRLGAGVLQLARRAQPLIADAALPALRRLAEAVGATAHLTVAEGTEGVALLVVEPTWTQFHVAYRVGSRHPLDRGAAGRAIIAARQTTSAATGDLATVLDDPPAVVSEGELQTGAHGVAAPVRGVEGLEASVGVVALAPLDVTTVGPIVVATAVTVSRALR
jgi:DNA-binding IclR family transcriptional regulator